VGLAVLAGALLWLLRGPIAQAYSTDPAVVAAALPLRAALAVFSVFDSLQTQIAFVLRAYKEQGVLMKRDAAEERLSVAP
jgi:MATE family multidrug resistance protein